MTRRALAATLLLAVLVPGSAGAQSPDPSASIAPTQGELALAAVRATDPRFADLPTFDDVRREVSRTFSYAPMFAGSWIDVTDTFDTMGDLGLGIPAWTDTGMGRIVEVMLVDGCADEIDGLAPDDPCTWRHSWLFHVASDGTVTTVAESATPDAP